MYMYQEETRDGVNKLKDKATMISETQRHARSILLIGSTVDGKKALAQFLYNQGTMEHDSNALWESKLNG